MTPWQVFIMDGSFSTCCTLLEDVINRFFFFVMLKIMKYCVKSTGLMRILLDLSYRDSFEGLFFKLLFCCGKRAENGLPSHCPVTHKVLTSGLVVCLENVNVCWMFGFCWLVLSWICFLEVLIKEGSNVTEWVVVLWCCLNYCCEQLNILFVSFCLWSSMKTKACFCVM